MTESVSVLEPGAERDGFFQARLVGRRRLTPRVDEFRFVRADGRPLPRAEPGAHIDLITPSGETRSYSLTSGPAAAAGELVIAVQRSPHSLGGSESMHASATPGAVLAMRGPTNTFALSPADDYLLIAGGIGITPLRPMLHALGTRPDARVRLLYLVRSREDAAYLEELSAAARPGLSVEVYATDEHDGRRFDLWRVLAEPGETHVYCCASEAVTEEVRTLTAHWRTSRVRFEQFSNTNLMGDFDAPFVAVWEPTRERIEVAAGESLLEALERSGIPVDSSCRSGICGSCRLALVDGEVEHHDAVLSDEERLRALASCVSRGVGTVSVGPPDNGPVS